MTNNVTQQAIVTELRKAREAIGMSQPMLADRAGYSLTAIRSLEKSKYSPRFQMFLDVCATIGVGPGEIIRRAGGNDD